MSWAWTSKLTQLRRRERLRRRIPLAADQRAVMEPGGEAGSERGKEVRPIDVHPVRMEADYDWALITAT
jgi:hypothetical protein